MHELKGATKNNANSAISSHVINLPPNAGNDNSSPVVLPAIFVATPPGAIAFERIPYFPNSTASPSVYCIIIFFEKPYGFVPATFPVSDEIFNITPLIFSSIK